MSSQYRKIKYQSEGPYASWEDRWLYIHSHDTCDVVNVFNENGEHLFCFSETGFDLGMALQVAFSNWQDERMIHVGWDEWNDKIKKS